MDSPTPSGTPSSPTSFVVSTPTPLNNEPGSFPDYSIWTPDRFKAFAGLGLYHEPKKELKWWWKYGFRLKGPKRPLKLQQTWVCEACFRPSSSSDAPTAANQQPVPTMLQCRKRFYQAGAASKVPDSQGTQDTRQASKRRKGKKATPIRREDTPDDELEQYLTAPINDLPAYFDDPVGWWRDVCHRLWACIVAFGDALSQGTHRNFATLLRLMNCVTPLYK